MFGAMREWPDSLGPGAGLVMRYIIGLCLALLLVQRVSAGDAVLDYTLVGLKGALEENVVAWLRELPETPQERLNFLVTAEEQVEKSLQALGYFRAEITLEVERTEPEWLLTVTVEPGEPVLIEKVDIELTGAAADDDAFASLVASAPFAVGDVLNQGEYDRFRNRLLSLGQERGYFDADLSENRVAVNVAANSAHIFLHYDSGTRFRFGPVNYDEEQADSDLLQTLQPFSEGDFFDQASLQLFQAQLQSTRYFSGVVLRPQLSEATDYRVPISLQLFPARSHSFDVGVGYSTDTQERVSFIWRTPKINSRGDSQETRLSWSAVNPSGRFTYSIPRGNPLEDMLHLSVLVENNEYGDIESRQKQLGVRREARWDDWLLGFSVRGLDESWELKNIKEDALYTLPGVSISRRDYIGSLVDPKAGFSQLYQLEMADRDLGSDTNLLRVTADFRLVFTPVPGHRVVGRGQLGGAFFTDSDPRELAPSLNFFAGGSQSIRGYGYHSIGTEVKVNRDDGSRQTLVVGGNRLVVGSIEYQYYFTETWRGALFVDAGDAFDDGEFDLNVGPGFGIHYMSPVGAIRLEFANSATDDDSSWRMHLNIGAEF